MDCTNFIDIKIQIQTENNDNLNFHVQLHPSKSQRNYFLSFYEPYRLSEHTYGVPETHRIRRNPGYDQGYVVRILAYETYLQCICNIEGPESSL